MFLAAIFVMGALLWLSIASAGKPKGRWRALQFLIAALVIAVVYELLVTSLHPDWNIHVEFLLIPLFLVALAKVIIPPAHPPTEGVSHVLTKQNGPRLPPLTSAETPLAHPIATINPATRCLYFSLINVVFWMVPLLAIAAIYYGYKALSAQPSSDDHRLKAVIGLAVAIPQVVAAVYLWFFT